MKIFNNKHYHNIYSWPFQKLPGFTGAAVLLLALLAPLAAGSSGSVIFYNGNDGGVSPGGTSPSFSVDRPVRITYMFTYHYRYQGGPGQIRIMDAAGGVVGAWNAQGRASSPEPSWYWEVTPNIDLGPGTYPMPLS